MTGSVEPREWRTPTWMRVACWAPGLVAVGGAIDLMVRPSPAYPDGAPLGEVLLFLSVVMTPVLVLAHVVFAASLRMDEAGVTVRALRTRLVPWADIARAEAGYWGITIFRRDGRRATTWVGQKTNWAIMRGKRTWGDEVAELITRIAETRRGL